MTFKERWESLALHTWLILSSYGIIFALLSFIEDLGILHKLKSEYPCIKGIIAIFIGLLFYLFIGLPHLNGAKTYTKTSLSNPSLSNELDNDGIKNLNNV